MKAQFRNRYFFAIDIIGLAAAVYVSFVLRYDSLAIPAAHAGSSLTLFLILALGITPLVFLQQGIYSRYWPYASLDELLLLARSVAVATILVGLCAFVVGEVFCLFPDHLFLAVACVYCHSAACNAAFDAPSQSSDQASSCC